MSGKKILIITYYWPPSGGVGVQRWLHFAINLKKLGFEPIIYTPKNPQFEISDHDLVHLVRDIEVVKKSIWEPFAFFHKITGNKNKKGVKQGMVLEKPEQTFLDKLFVWVRGNLFVPDSRIFWVRPSVKFLSEYLTANNIQTIITTGPPHSMHLIGLALKRKEPTLKWLADFRDPWSHWDLLGRLYTTKIVHHLHRKLEKKVVENSDRLIVTSRGTGELFKLKYNIDPEVIMNGISIVESGKSESDDSSDRFVIGYFGMLNEFRNPRTFWECIEEIFSQNKSFRDVVEIRIGGIISESIVAELKTKYSFYKNIKFLGYLPHNEVFEEYKKSSVLLLLQNQTSNSEFLIPAKFFEYLTAFKPILGIGIIPSDLHGFFKDGSIGSFVKTSDADGIKDFILSNFNAGFKTNFEDYERLLKEHSRENQAQKLVSSLKKL